jgi:5'(3')-deoxyribonucleotidase
VNDKTLLVDMDGVLAEFVPAVFAEHNRRFGTSYTEADMKRYLFKDSVSCPEHLANMNSIFREPGFFSALRMCDGALEMVNKLCALGCVEICSSPPNTRVRHWGGEISVQLAHVAAEKIGWVIRHLPHLGGQVTLTSKKFLVDGDALIDDSTENVIKWCARHPKGLGVIVSRNWNAAVEDYIFPKNVVRVELEKVPDIIQSWFLLK